MFHLLHLYINYLEFHSIRDQSVLFYSIIVSVTYISVAWRIFLSSYFLCCCYFRVPLTHLPSLWGLFLQSTSLLSGITRCSSVISYISCAILQPTTSLRSPGSSYWNIVLDARSGCQVFCVPSGMQLPLDCDYFQTLSVDKARNVCVHKYFHV